MDEIAIRQLRGPEEYPRLVQVWRSAVEATHDFLAEEHRASIEGRLAAEYFPHVVHNHTNTKGEPVGFAGTVGGNLEMLFVEAAHRGRGIGKALLDHVRRVESVTTVDVNEQNTQAVEFYGRAGFVVVGRSPVDGEGLPYPLLHMRVAGTA
mgnify:FL=1